MMSPKASALIGALLALPMGILIPAVAFELWPIESALKAMLTIDGSQPNALGSVVIFGGLLALPVALAVSVWPMARKGADGRRRLYVVNLALAAVIVALMAPTWGGLAEEVYRCDILQIPNCD
jgi:hypothetical protein